MKNLHQNCPVVKLFENYMPGMTTGILKKIQSAKRETFEIMTCAIHGSIKTRSPMPYVIFVLLTLAASLSFAPENARGKKAAAPVASRIQTHTVN
jgi:hypothetical protein